MTSELREHLRQAIDAHKRERIAAARTYGPHCAGCGSDLDTYTVGCRNCSNRRNNRIRQTDPEYRRKQAKRSRERRLERGKVTGETRATINR